MILRILSDLVIFLVAILYPGWWFIVLGGIASYFFNNFFEVVVFALLVDLLYGFPVPGYYGFRFIFFSISILIFLFSLIMRRMVRFFR